MPFYEYQCTACQFHTEVLQKITDPALTECPSCGKASMQRLISAPVFRLKGSGWYETDFKSDKENKRNLADDKEPAKSDDGAKSKVRASKALKKVAAKKPVASAAKAPKRAAKSALAASAKSTAKPKPAAKKPAVKKSAVKKSPVKQPSIKRPPSKTSPVKRSVAKQSAAKALSRSGAKPKRSIAKSAARKK